MIPEAPPDPVDDAELIRRSRRDPEAFADLFDRHASALHRYVARRLGASLADDVVSDTFLTAFRKRERYDLTQPDARPWLYGIAANLERHVVMPPKLEGAMFRALMKIPRVVVEKDVADAAGRRL